MKRKYKGQLVYQHLEKISRKLLEKYPKIVREFARGKHGIYALYKDDKLCYVGLASKLSSRLRHHLRDRHGATWDRFSIYLILSDEHLRELESLVLRISSPKGNIQAGKFIKSQNLLRSVQKKIREIQRRERMDFLGEVETLPKEKPKVKKDRNLGTLAPFISKRFQIRFRYKGRLYIGNVRKDGWITFDFRSAEYKKFRGKKFRSPSMAGAVITGRHTNGWTCWKYRNSKGEWMLIDKLRKKK